ncbi:MAG: signal peptidase I [Candidatus Binatia bacterium]
MSDKHAADTAKPAVAAPAEKSRWRQNVESIGLALLIALAVRSSVVQAFWVPSGSMLPTIQIGDHIFVNKLAYSVRLPLIGTELLHVGDLERGEIVVFISPIDRSTDLIKRVIAIPGDTVEIRNKALYVNGEKLDDPHAHFSDDTVQSSNRDNMPPTQVPEGKFFVMGDNRDKSYDSRYWGFANVADIKGKATFIYWSRDVSQGWLATPRFERFGHFIN